MMSSNPSSPAARWRRLWAVCLVALVMAACRPRGAEIPEGTDAAAAAAQLRAHLQKHPDDDDARRELALIEWIHLRQPEVAGPRLAALAGRGDTTGRLARIVVADARLDYATVEQETFALVKAAAKDPTADSGLAAAAAEFAVRRLREHHGRRPGDDDRFVAFFDALDRRRLPVEVAQPLISERASIARRRGKDYARYYAQEGCVQTWTVGRVQGTQGTLDLPSLSSGPLDVDPDAVLAQLACVVRVWNPNAAPGVRRLQSYLQTEATTLSLELGAQHGTRFYLDGQLLHRTDRVDRYPASHARYEVEVAAGLHVLELATALEGERGWVLVRATDAAGRPVKLASKAPTAGVGLRGKPRRVDGIRFDRDEGPLASRFAAPLATLLHVEDAIADGAADRGEQALLEGDHDMGDTTVPFAEGELWRAHLWRLDDSRGGSISATRERRALRAALRYDKRSDAARLRLLRLRLGRGEQQEVAKILAKLAKGRLRTVEGELLRARVHSARDDEFAADSALARAEKLNPEDCQVLVALRSRAQSRDDVKTEDEVADRLRPCAGSLKLRARLAERRGRLDDAIALWNEQLERVPDEIEALESLSQLHALRGEDDKAEGYLRQILALNPFRVGSHIALADLAASRGEVKAARDHLRGALDQIPHATPLWEAAQTLGLPDELPHWRVDGREALAEYQKSGVEYEGVAEVLVLDRSVVRVYPDGGQRQLVHLVVQLLSKEALDRYGEISLPDGARLLTLHSIKPDGTTLEPEVVAGKDGVSLRDLAMGDFVEYEFLVDQPASPQLSGYVDVSTFRFQSLDVPYHRSELVVLAPPDVALRSDRRNDPPEEKVEPVELGGTKLVRRHWRATNVPRLGVEPGHRPLLDEVPSVHVYTPLPLPAWLAALAGQVRDSQRTNPQLRGLVQRLTAKRKSPRAKLTALWKWVVTNVEPGGDLTIPATVTFAEKRGNRLMLLRAMLQTAGIASEVWLVKDAFGPKPIDGGHPLVEMYDAPMLAVRLQPDQPPLMVTTASEVIPMGYLAPGYRKAPGLRLPLDGEDTPPAVKLPDARKNLRDGRHWELDVALDATGDAVIEGSVELTGMEAVRWRGALEQLDRDRVPDVFVEAELGWLRGGTLGDLTIEGEHDLEAPLRLHFSAQGSGLGVQQGGARVLQAAPMPLAVAPGYASLPTRTTGLVVPYAPDISAKITYRLDGARFSDVPKAAALKSEWGTYTRKLVEGGAGQASLTLHIDSTLRTGVVPPDRYEDLAAFARDIEAVQEAVLRLK